MRFMERIKTILRHLEGHLIREGFKTNFNFMVKKKKFHGKKHKHASCG